MPEKNLRTELPSAQGGVIDLISGHPLFARCWRGQGHKSVMIGIHGAESHSGWFSHLADQLQTESVDTFAYDRMGWGQSPGETGELTSLHDVYDELSSLIYIMREKYDRIHLVGISWGGLYLLYAYPHLASIVNTVTVISPGLFLKRAVTSKSLKASFAQVFSSHHWRLHLPYGPESFCVDPISRRYIAEDPWRQKSVGPRFIGATLFMQSWIRNPWYKKSHHQLQVVLGDQDQMIDIRRTANFCEDREVSYKILSGAHTLILDNPKDVARNIGSLDRNSRIEDIEGLIKSDFALSEGVG